VEPKQKKQKKLSKRQLKKQKKKDRKAAFPSSNSNGGAQQQNYVGGNLVTEQTAQITQARDGKLLLLFSLLVKGVCLFGWFSFCAHHMPHSLYLYFNII